MGRQKEKREFPRRDCLMVCRCEGEGYHSNGHIINISHGGAGIAGTNKVPAQGVELVITILLSWKKIELRSKVVWVKSGAKEPGLANFGVEFLDSLTERQDKLEDFIPK